MSVPLDRARAAIALRRWDAALEALDAALSDDHDNPMAHALRAEVFYRQRRYIEAQAAAKEAIRAEPEWGVGYFWLGWSYLSSGPLEPPAIDRAREAVEEALRCNPDDPDFWALSAQTALVEGDAREAASHAQTGLENDPDHEGCLEALAAAQQAYSAVDKKRKTLLRLVELNPESVFAHRQLATDALAEGKPLEAFQHARSAIHIDPGDADARDTYQEVVRHQHPAIRLLLWSSTPWHRYAWFPVLGGIPLVLLMLRKPNPGQGDPWFWAAFCFFVMFVGYGLFAIVLVEFIASHSRRLSPILPEAAATRRCFLVAGVIIGVFAAAIGLAVWWRGPLPVIAVVNGATLIFLVSCLRKAITKRDQIGFVVLLLAPVVATASAAMYDCHPDPGIWFIAMIVVTCLVWAAALKLSKSEYA